MLDNNKPSIDGVKRQTTKREPDLRPDHDLPAPEATPLLSEGKELSVLPPIHDTSEQPVKQPHRKRNLILAILVTLLVAIVAVGVAAFSWYQQQLSPLTSDTSKRVRVTIESGSAPSVIAEQLQSSGVIRSQLAFTIHTKLTGSENDFKAGSYSLQPSVSTPAIIEHLISGKQDTFRLTFLPGDTLANNRQKIIKAGYSEQEVDTALDKLYDRPLFIGKPANADLEGYIFGETYEFTVAASAETILNRTFDEFEAFIQENKLVEAYRKQNLSLYQGITLASVIQKEVSGVQDSQQVAQVFLKRLKEGIPLGADATFVYAAQKAGKQPTVDFDSPYNTRIYKGLPPGPISVPGVNALRAVANPAPGNYLYFVSGDDGTTYFSRTDAEHQQKTRQYCQKNCALF